MMIGGVCLGVTALASASHFSTALTTIEDQFPLTVLHRNSHVKPKRNSLNIDDTQGEQVSATFVLVDPTTAPAPGDPVEVKYFGQVLFSGTIEQVSINANSAKTAIEYRCECVDWSQVLVRHKIRQRFTNVTIASLTAALLDNELLGEGFSFGSSDQHGIMDLVDADNVSVFDLLRDAAGISGQTFYVEFDKTLRFRATSNTSAPFDLTDNTVMDAKVREDRSYYRNVQVVVAKGTPASGSNEVAIEYMTTQENDEQIAQRAAIEGGTGRYISIDTITHPISNAIHSVSTLAGVYANLLLSSRGTLRRVVTARIRAYGFRAGQSAIVSLPWLNISGTWLVQRVSTREEDGARLVYDVEIVESSLQQREYESWASILRKGKIIVSTPGVDLSSGTSTASFTTPGTDQWISPIDGTITITAMGGSGGGGGASIGGDGGRGGHSGKTVSNVEVHIGDILDITIGSRGNGGSTGVSDTNGTAGTLSKVMRSGVNLCQANGGGGGKSFNNGAAAGTSGGGSNGVVTVGGGKTGGAKGTETPPVNGSVGKHGEVVIQY